VQKQKKTNHIIFKTKWGFYQYRPLPTNKELKVYYETKYYQEGRGSYEIEYSDDELKWIKQRNFMLYQKAIQLLQNGTKTFLDIGCGEGWLMAEFHSNGHQITGIDFSDAGVKKYHSNLLKFFKKADIYTSVNKIIKAKKSFDIISLCNVIEHIKYPIKLLKMIKSIMHSKSLLIIVAPNDFSLLHQYLLDSDIISDQWWLGYPDHLSYFNKESMCDLLVDLGYEVKNIVADNPIDLNLLNDNSNYVKDRSKGKKTHLFRVRMDNFLGKIDRDKLALIYEILGSMGVGRNLSYYSTLKT